jgi:RNA polymerase sigma factor (sigma-70 family)
MEREELTRWLNKLSTAWTVLRQAQGMSSEATAARQLLVERYGGAVRRYLLAAVRDPGEADDLVQEFALAFVAGRFQGADPGRGRFRDYPRTALFHLVGKHRRRQKRLARLFAADAPDPADLPAPADDPDRRFDETWRAELLARAWAALADAQPAYHALLRLRSDRPELHSHELAEHLSRTTGKPVTAGNVRQTLRRARDRFAELLVDEVAHTLAEPTAERLEEELRILDLLGYCQPALGGRP